MPNGAQTPTQGITRAVQAANAARAASAEAGRQVAADRAAARAMEQGGQGSPEIPSER